MSKADDVKARLARHMQCHPYAGADLLHDFDAALAEAKAETREEWAHLLWSFGAHVPGCARKGETDEGCDCGWVGTRALMNAAMGDES